MARAIWKGTITFGDVRLPVKLYSAIEDTSVHFHLLHDQDMVRLKQQMVNSETGEPVESAKARKGFEIDRGTFVILDDEELDSLEPSPSRDIAIEKFLPSEGIPHQWYDRPYYLGPDDNLEDYSALAQALEPLAQVGLARWTMRKRPYLGALRADDGYLMLVTLRNSDEVIEADDVPPPKGKPLDNKELKLAAQLIEMLKGDFDPEQYHDEYRQRVLDLIESKRKGGKIKLEKPRTRKPPRTSLADALRASLVAAK